MLSENQIMYKKEYHIANIINSWIWLKENSTKAELKSYSARIKAATGGTSDGSSEQAGMLSESELRAAREWAETTAMVAVAGEERPSRLEGSGPGSGTTEAQRPVVAEDLQVRGQEALRRDWRVPGGGADL